RVVKLYGKKYSDMDQKLPDPILEEFARLNKRISKLEDECGILSCKYSISNEYDENNKIDDEGNEEK
ncbi:MAG: hypothetical protein ACOCWI_05425, partial [Bacillota bacterium]